MELQWSRSERNIELLLLGELDHHAARDIICEISAVIDEHLPLNCQLNLEKLTFMDSSGIAVIMSVYKRMYEIGGTLIVKNVPRQASRVLSASGLDKIVNIAVAS